MDAEIVLRVDGSEYSLTVDTRTTLLDALRERLGITSVKKGCDHGQCGACTVLLDGRRAISCLALAATPRCPRRTFLISGGDVDHHLQEGRVLAVGGERPVNLLEREACVDEAVEVDASRCCECDRGRI